ncbi:endonuclease V isoform X1 [Mesocricetus auratus]|uniref:Endonuclease V n=1 Tax=Mesocricetus auratus TaxID=10036 RepID=A0A1U8BNX2_MESAU|nr:endonuclease V isoform X1 [Mesocricetus auratus]XP_012968891.1 endonuclease V isoform X1 [Mesocricetus auratus]XP_040606091.1 endonuclease V isoform X1 [Mesocricetus auratus]
MGRQKGERISLGRDDAPRPLSPFGCLCPAREQARLKTRVVHGDTEAWQRDPAFSGLRRVGGVDVSFVNGDSSGACASLVVLSYPELKVVYEDSHMVRLQAPYVSGFLAFREVPFLVELVQRLQEKEPGLMPQVLLVDGNGVLHQRGFGVACHLGVLTDLPCIGVAKKLLQVDGLENNSLHKEKIVLLQAGGDTFPLMGDSGTVLGMALKSHDHSTKPLYVSVGHRISLEVAVRLTHLCCRFRIPEPIRQADIRSREHIRRTLGHPGSPAQRQERRQKEQRPKACPGAPAGPCSLPEDCGRDSSTDLKDPQPGFQEQQKDQQSEGSGHHEDSDLWPPSPVWVQSPPREEDL